MLECTAPRPRDAGYTSLEVTTDGRTYSTGGVQFEFIVSARVRAVEPSSGPVAGGTFVNVTGEGFSRRAAQLGYLACRFNASVGAAAWRSESELHCVAPQHASGAVSVELTQNEQQYTSDGVAFEYVHSLMHAVRPRAGPADGGTLVELRGRGMRMPAARGLLCQFGSADAVGATRESDELIRCVSPAAVTASVGTVRVRVLHDDAVSAGGGFDAGAGALSFTYRSPSVVQRVHPIGRAHV